MWNESLLARPDLWEWGSASVLCNVSIFTDSLLNCLCYSLTDDLSHKRVVVYKNTSYRAKSFVLVLLIHFFTEGRPLPLTDVTARAISLTINAEGRGTVSAPLFYGNYIGGGVSNSIGRYFVQPSNHLTLFNVVFSYFLDVHTIWLSMIHVHIGHKSIH